MQRQFTVTAVYENGVFRPLSDVASLKESQEVELIVHVFKPIETEEERQASIERGLKAVEDSVGIIPIDDPELVRQIALDPEFGSEE
jgi:predicted DNA-binding antitoxin AbrB/MazE fold protein